MTAQIPVGPHESSSLIRSDSVFESGKIILNGDSGTALSIVNNANVISDGDATFETINADNIIIINDTNTIKIGKPSYAVNETFPNLGTTEWSSNIGLGIYNSMTIPDGFNEIEQWIDKYLIDTPPQVVIQTFGEVNDEYIYATWTFKDVIDVGFSDINLPHHETVFIKYVKSSLNGAQDFADGSTVTIDTGSKLTDEVRIYIDTGSSFLNGTIYEEYGNIEASTDYDIRIYLVNHNTTRATKYTDVFNIITGTIGVPTVPLNLTSLTVSPTTVFLDFDEPIDHNDTGAGNNTLPYIKSYTAAFSATSSLRYGGLINDSGSKSTAIAVGSNAVTEINVDNLASPGTTYSFNVFATNSKNPGASPNANVSGFADYPTQGVSMNAYTFTFPSALFAPYTQGGYNLSASTFFNYIVNYNNTNGVLDTLDITTDTTSAFNLNEVAGDSSTNPVSRATLSAGVQGSLEDIIYNFTPFGGTNPVSALTVGTDISLGTTNNQDHHSANPVASQGFWRSSQLYVTCDKTTIFQPTNDVYEIYITHRLFPSVTDEISNSLIFAIDDINIAPSLSYTGVSGIQSDNPAMISYVSGVPTYNSTVIFSYRLTITEIGNNYLRLDLNHASITVSDNTSAIGTEVFINQADIGGSHKYYDSDTWNISSTLHNTSGLELEPVDNFNPRVDIQFNDFEVDLTGVNADYFTDDLKLAIIAQNLYGVSSTTYENYRNNLGTAQALRIDLHSLNNDYSAYAVTHLYGQQVTSGDTDFPSDFGVDFGLAYDHTKDILTDAGYLLELQQVDKAFRTPAYSNGFSDYSSYFYPVSLSITTPNYSTVTLTGYRYVTFKYTRSFSDFKNKVSLTLINQTGLTTDFSIFGGSNHKLHIRIEDPRTLSPGEYTFATNWLSATDAIDIMGVSNAVDDDGCLLTDLSSNTVRICSLKPFTEDAIFYVKIGLDVTQDHIIENIQLDLI